jgi:hypothetical protein
VLPVTDFYVSEFANLFAGNPNQFAKGWLKDAARRKYGWGMVKVGEGDDARPLPLTESQYKVHLDGVTPIGIYPLHEGRVKWACVDFDVAKAVDGELTDAWSHDRKFGAIIEDALAQLEAFNTAGLFAHLERSRSGNGAHVWVFFDQWLDAHLVRAAILPRLLPSPHMDRGKIYPSDPDKSEHGVLIGLPYQPNCLAYEGSAFLNPDSLEPLTLEAFLGAVLTNNAAAAARAPAAGAPTRSTRRGS